MGATQAKAGLSDKEQEKLALLVKQTKFQYFYAFLQAHPELDSYVREVYLKCKDEEGRVQKCASNISLDLLNYVPYIYPDLFLSRILPKLMISTTKVNDTEIYESLFRLLSFDNYNTMKELFTNSKFKSLVRNSRVSDLFSSALKNSIFLETSYTQQKFQNWLWNNMLVNDLITTEVLMKFLDTKTEPYMTYVLMPNMKLTKKEQDFLYPNMVRYWNNHYTLDKWKELLQAYTSIKRCGVWIYIFKQLSYENTQYIIKNHPDLFCSEMWATLLYLADDIHDTDTMIYLNAITISTYELSDIIDAYRIMYPDPKIDFRIQDILETYNRNTDKLIKLQPQ